jgi:hypothetical protein
VPERKEREREAVREQRGYVRIGRGVVPRAISNEISPSKMSTRAVPTPGAALVDDRARRSRGASQDVERGAHPTPGPGASCP